MQGSKACTAICCLASQADGPGNSSTKFTLINFPPRTVQIWFVDNSNDLGSDECTKIDGTCEMASIIEWARDSSLD